LVRKFIQAIRDKKIRPYEDPEHCLITIIFILGYYCGLRGSSEHIDLDSEMVCIGEHTVEDGPELAGLKWAGVKVPFSKTNQLNMSNTHLPVDEDVLLTFVEQPWHDCFDPHAIFCFFVAHCHPKAKKFCGRLVKQGPKKEGERLEKEFGRPVWYAESGHGRACANWNLGPTKHRELCKKITFLAGVDKWEACKGHALRALCITHCIASNLTAVDVAAKVRHASVNSQKGYATDCNERKANRILAMAEKPEDSSNKKRAAEDVAEDAVIVQTQPMLPENRNKFLHVSKKARVAPEPKTFEANSIVSDENLDSELEKLKKQNEILRLAMENKRMQEELAGSSNRQEHHSPVPRCHRRSYPPSYHRSPLEDRFYHPQQRVDEYQPMPLPPREDCRRSCPPTNFYPRSSPPRCYGSRRSSHCERHGGYSEEECDDYQRGYHRR